MDMHEAGHTRHWGSYQDVGSHGSSLCAGLQVAQQDAVEGEAGGCIHSEVQ